MSPALAVGLVVVVVVVVAAAAAVGLGPRPLLQRRVALLQPCVRPQQPEGLRSIM